MERGSANRPRQTERAVVRREHPAWYGGMGLTSSRGDRRWGRQHYQSGPGLRAAGVVAPGLPRACQERISWSQARSAWLVARATTSMPRRYGSFTSRARSGWSPS